MLFKNTMQNLYTILPIFLRYHAAVFFFSKVRVSDGNRFDYFNAVVSIKTTKF